jgi:hypothetical protein
MSGKAEVQMKPTKAERRKLGRQIRRGRIIKITKGSKQQ